MNKNWLLVPLFFLLSCGSIDEPPVISTQTEPQEEMITIPKAQFEAAYEVYKARGIRMEILQKNLSVCQSLFSAQYPYYQ